jgi:hypothetical protein
VVEVLSEIKNATETISPELFEVQEIREAIELLQESAYTKSELVADDKYWDSISVERTLLVDSFAEGKTEGIIEGIIEGKIEGKIEGIIEGKVEGKSEGINLMIVNRRKAGISIGILSAMAQISAEEVVAILTNYGVI